VLSTGEGQQHLATRLQDDGLPDGSGPSVAPFDSYDWQHRIAENILRGCTREILIDTMMRAVDCDFATATSAVEKVLGSPIAKAADEFVMRLKKLEAYLELRTDLEGLSVRSHEIDVRSGLSRAEFLEEYYSANRPVVLKDMADDWPALTRWDTPYFRRVFGSAPVEVMTKRDSDDQFELNCERHREVMPFDLYANHVETCVGSNDSYLVAHNKLLEHPEAALLLDDFRIDDRYLDPERVRGETFLWYGPAGTFTPIHHDANNILFVQVRGRKHITLVSPFELPMLYNRVMPDHVTVFSEISDIHDGDQVDLYPDLRRVNPIDIVVSPGDALFIPIWWWHQVRSAETSISLSFTGFVYPNPSRPS
jgi:hypothetical protein